MAARPIVEEQQQARRSQLIRATFQEVSEKCFADVTLEDIAGRAGLSKGVALYYFDSKEALFLAAFERSIGALRERLRAAIRAASGPVEKVKAVIDTTFVSAKDNRNFYRGYLDFLCLGTRQEAFRKLNARFYQGCVAMETEIVEEGVRRGLFRPHADPAILRAIFDGLMLQWLFDDPGAFERYRSRCRRAVLRYLGVRGAKR